MTSREKVLEKFPRATSREYHTTHDWEIYETEDTETSRVLGNGSCLGVTFDQDMVDYKATEDAAWDDALRNIEAEQAFGDLAKNILKTCFDEISRLIPANVSAEETQELMTVDIARLIFDAKAQVA